MQQLLALEDHWRFEGCDLDAAVEILSESCWDGSLQEARAARVGLYALLGMPAPVSKS